MAKIVIINGPNLNLLGIREPKKYGCVSLKKLNYLLRNSTRHQMFFYQSNIEGNLIAKIHATLEEHIDLIIINAAAYTHTSLAIRDALLAVAVPFIEVHITNIHAREHYRTKSYLSDIAIGVITGFGIDSYFLALLAADRYLDMNKSRKN